MKTKEKTNQFKELFYLSNFLNSKFLRPMTVFMFLMLTGYFSYSQYNLSGGSAANLGGGCYRLTSASNGQLGTLWFQNKISLASDLTVEGSVYLGSNNGGADGIAFVLQPVCGGAGSSGGGLGYQGITPSLAVEFDTWQNSTDPGNDHIGLMKNGNVSHNTGVSGPITALQNYISLNNLEDGAYHSLKIEWIASSKTLKVTLDGTLRINYTDDIVANIFSGNKNVYWGFTAATGAANNDQRVCISSTNFTEDGSYTVTKPSCPNFNNGAIDLNPAGGLSPFTYTWSNGQTTEDISGLSAGTYSVVVRDRNGCQSKFTIVLTNEVDTENPVITCPSDISVQCASDVPAPNTGLVTATDNCSATVSYVGDVVSNKTCDNQYTISRTYKATDPTGNSATCTQIITVNDDKAPSLAGTLPGGASGNLCLSDATSAPSEASIAALYTDNCSAVTATLLSSSVTGDNCNWTATYTFGVKDDCGNAASDAVVVYTGGDTEAPTLTCPGTITKCGAQTVTFNATATDNCGSVNISYSPASGSNFNVGTTTVTVTATDDCNNTSECTFDVVINPNPTCSISVTPSNNTYTGGNPRNIYLGYGPQSATMTANATGGSGFTYSWSPSTYLSNASIQNPVFTPTAEGNYTYTVIVTNSNGCSTTCSVTFCVKDVNVTGKGGSGKVYLCHVPPGNSSNPQTLSISVNAVPSHLSEHSGDALGKCGATCNNNKRTIIDELVVDIENLEITCSPNPFSQSFKLNYISSFSSEATISVYGITGNLLEQTHVSGNSNQVELGNNLPAGIYTVSFNQGELVKVFKMIKVN